MMLRTVSLCLDSIPAAHLDEIVPRQSLPQRRERVHPLISAHRPARLEHDHQGGGPGVQIADQLGPECLDRWMTRIVEEMEIVEEACGLPQAKRQQRVHAAL